jgi:hypothetical protein
VDRDGVIVAAHAVARGTVDRVLALLQAWGYVAPSLFAEWHMAPAPT